MASANPATAPSRVGRGHVGDGERRARRAERHHCLAWLHPEAQRCTHVVAGTDGDSGTAPLAHHLERIGHAAPRLSSQRSRSMNPRMSQRYSPVAGDQ